MRFESAFSGCFIAFLLLVSSFSKAQMPKEKSKQKKGPSPKKSSIGKGKSKGGKKKGPPTPPNTSDVIAFWYKPHFQCNGADGSTPARAARFINQQLEPPTTVTTADAAVPAPAADFVGISEWTGPQNLTIGKDIFIHFRSIYSFDYSFVRLFLMLIIVKLIGFLSFFFFSFLVFFFSFFF